MRDAEFPETAFFFEEETDPDFEEAYWDEEASACFDAPEPVWETSVDGGFLFPLLLPPALVLFFGGLLALLVSATFTPPIVSAEEERAETHPPAPAEARPSGGAQARTLAPLFTPEVQYWEKDILRWARQWNLDPNLIATVMQIESCGNPQALSRAGAAGLFQVMPFHFKPGEDPYDPETNALRGMGYLRRALDAFGQDSRLALAGYNGGIGGASRPESLWAAETVRYAYWGAGIYAEARAGKKQSARLQEWLNAGGASLCRQARSVLGVR